eukprot:TRINITY_DN4638_c0_g1_i1.p2 TRINITY_DN4638_c0_g1~~TRINITY_DN4638_c0_g1_i1.p2  ORF type:complete len:92 (+),score=13.66 TRINITY_DN4638_c0_g1_i1:249-524(+)
MKEQGGCAISSIVIMDLTQVTKRTDLLQMLADNETTECAICDKMATEPCISRCEHIYCYPCLIDAVEIGNEIGKPIQVRNMRYAHPSHKKL